MRNKLYGYTNPAWDTDVFIRDIDKFGPAWGPNPTAQGRLNEQIAGTIAHEYGHQTLETDPRFADIKADVMGTMGSGYKNYLESGIQGLGTKHMTNELFNRALDLRHAIAQKGDLKGIESGRDLAYIEGLLRGEDAGTHVPWLDTANPHLEARPMSINEFWNLTNPSVNKYMQ